MKPAPFEYVRPKTLAEASAALAQNGLSTAAIAGGQSLLPMLSLRVALPDLVVDLGRLDDLKGTRETADGLWVGALTTHAAIEDGKLPDLFNGLMRRVAGGISYRAVRNCGTIGGSVALADPAADWPGCLVALGASARISGPNGERTEPVADLVLDTYATTLQSGEIILGFDIPRPAAPLRWGVAKVVRKSGAFAHSIAFAVTQGSRGPVSVILAAAATRPVQLATVAGALQSGAATEESLRPAIARDLAERVPDADAYQYRLHTATVLRAIREMRAQ
jgi:aerobic carbon-monoxide dehydrogenase medium subunit